MLSMYGDPGVEYAIGSVSPTREKERVCLRRQGQKRYEGIVFERLAKGRMMTRRVEREFKMSTACDPHRLCTTYYMLGLVLVYRVRRLDIFSGVETTSYRGFGLLLLLLRKSTITRNSA